MGVFIEGFLVGLSLIMAIGSQNAFVMRQGLKSEYIREVVLFCAISDAFLIFMGVFGAGAIMNALPALKNLLMISGAIFLFIYGALRLRSAFQPSDSNLHMDEKDKIRKETLKSVLAACFAFTFLNPHVYLDTWVLLGSLSVNYSFEGKAAFAAGASTASFVFFTSLGYGARLLQPIFENPRAWQIFDVLIGVFMWVLSAGLIYEVLNHH